MVKIRWGEARKMGTWSLSTTQYQASSKKDVEMAKKGIIDGVDTKKDMKYHKFHLDYEKITLKTLTNWKARNLLMKHMEGHKLALELKGITV